MGNGGGDSASPKSTQVCLTYELQIHVIQVRYREMALKFNHPALLTLERHGGVDPYNTTVDLSFFDQLLEPYVSHDVLV